MKYPLFLITVLVLFIPLTLLAQPDSGVSKQTSYGTLYVSDLTEDRILDSIILKGNRRTRDFIVLREVDLKTGDTLKATTLMSQLERIQFRLFNTGLFLQIDLSLDRSTLSLTVRERFYTYPAALLSLADRNFNEWWQTHDRDLKRLDYGLWLIQKNIRGRNEKLKLKLQSGFNQKAELSYQIPYIDRKLKTGIVLNAGYISNRIIAYQTRDNKLDFYEHNNRARTRITAGLALTHRARMYQFHVLGLDFHSNTIADTLAMLNPDYFLEGRTRQRYLQLYYTYTSDHRDIWYYPLKGYYLRIESEGLGLGISPDINLYALRAELSGYKPINARTFAAMSLRGKLSTPNHQPYFNQRGLGYLKEWVSGYELYVIDGQQYGLLKANVKWKLFALERHLGFVPFKAFKTFPLAVYLKAFSDAGYVADRQGNLAGPLANTWLWGAGLGLDFVTYYDVVLRMEYSLNAQGGHGLFFNVKAGL